MTETYLAQAVTATEGRTIYDTNAKYLLADKQILAWILKYAVKEFEDLEIPDIISCIGDDIEVGTRPVDPGLSNYRRVSGSGTENGIPGEGTIVYDIRFCAHHKGTDMKFLINLEAQNSTDPSRLGYHLDNRIQYYLARMISAQKMTEFFNSDYDSLKNVRSIWICMGRKQDGDRIEEISLVKRTVFGGEENSCELALQKGVIIHLRMGEHLVTSKNRMIAMLEELISKKSVGEKKRILTEEYGMIMNEKLEGRMQSMCNWSAAFIEEGLRKGLEEGLEKGIEEGMEKGMEKGIKALVQENLDENISKNRILEKLQHYFQLDAEAAEAYYEKYAL